MKLWIEELEKEEHTPKYTPKCTEEGLKEIPW